MQTIDANNFLDGWEKLTGIERELARVELDPHYFCTKYVMTFDEDVKPPWNLYPDYEYLKTVIDKIMTPGDKYWLKSQRMLITITFCAIYLHQFLFADGFNGFVTSKAGAVDGKSKKSAWNSLFGKKRIMYDKLPGFVKEYALGRAYHSSEIFTFMAAQNPKNNNMMMGQAATENAGVGEGFTLAFVDECSSIYFMNAIHSNLTQSCKSNKNYVAFPRGKGNKFADIHFHPKHYGFEKVEIPYSMNPRYSQNWYNKLSEKMTSFEIAQRIDRSFEESTVGKVWKNFKYGPHVVPTEYLKEFPIYLFWDFGFVDATSVGFAQLVPQYEELDHGDSIHRPPKLRIFDWEELNYANVEDVSATLKGTLSNYSLVSTHAGGYGDPACAARLQDSGITLQDRYRENGFEIEVCDTHEILDSLGEIDKWFAQDRIQIDPKCTAIIDTCQYWGWPQDRQGNPKQGATNPIHNIYSHAGKALEYGFTMLCMQNIVSIDAVFKEDQNWGVNVFEEMD